jgi:lipase maturation factor 1
MEALIGSNGISPAQGFFASARRQFMPGRDRFYHYPSFLWWHCSDVAMHCICALGTLCGLLIAVNSIVSPALLAGVAWLCYLSMVTAAQQFANFQSDFLLLELGFLLVFFSPLRRGSRSNRFDPTVYFRQPLMIWLLRFLLCRVVFSMGVARLGSAPWRELMAFPYHFSTQPTPTPLAYALFQAPIWLHKALQVAVLAVELGAPTLLLLVPARFVRRAAVAALAAVQLFWLLTGGWGLLHWCTLALCTLFVDDVWFPRPVLAAAKRAYEHNNRVRAAAAAEVRQHARPAVKWRQPLHWNPFVLAVIVAVVIVLLIVPAGRLAQPISGNRVAPPKDFDRAFRLLSPWRIVSSYSMPAPFRFRRFEMVLEGSNSGQTWRQYQFAGKVDLLDTPPPSGWHLLGHHARLNTRLWEVADDGATRELWVAQLGHAVLRNNWDIRRLVERDPFAGQDSPRFIRGVRHCLEFTRIKADAVRDGVASATGGSDAKRYAFWRPLLEPELVTPTYSIAPPESREQRRIRASQRIHEEKLREYQSKFALNL